jgi:putative heme-binding domain-containing protein
MMECAPGGVGRLMRERWWSKFRVAAWLLMPGLCCAQVNPFAGNAEAAADGRKLFLQSCATCHGATGQGAEGQVEGMRPPDLTRGGFKAGRRDDDLFRVISEGVLGTPMPSFKSFGTDQIWRLVTFVRSLSAVTPALNGDPAAGETLFWGKGGCGRCHQMGSRGGRLGPDLSRGGSGGNASNRLKESIVDPNADITPGYAIVTVVTANGQTITGVERWLDNFSVRLIDESGNEHSFLRDEVKSATREMRSLMPGNYGQILTEAEINNLVAYIVATRSKANLQ